MIVTDTIKEEAMNTRKSDEELLIQFVGDQGWDQPDLVEAAERLKRCIAEKLQDYSWADPTCSDEF